MRDALRGESLVLCLALMNSRTPDVPAIAAASGYDAVYVDLEHTSTSLETAAMLCASATGAGIWALVRVSSQEPSLIARVLDMGATGILGICNKALRKVRRRGSEAAPMVHSG